MDSWTLEDVLDGTDDRLDRVLRRLFGTPPDDRPDCLGLEEALQLRVLLVTILQHSDTSLLMQYECTLRDVASSIKQRVPGGRLGVDLESLMHRAHLVAVALNPETLWCLHDRLHSSGETRRQPAALEKAAFTLS